MAWQNMTGVEPKYQIPNLRNKGFVRNVVLILPNCVSNCIGRFKLAQFLYELEKQGWSQNFMYPIEFFFCLMVAWFYLKYAVFEF